MGSQSCKLLEIREANARVNFRGGKNPVYAIVFGGTAGIGEALATRLAAAGAKVTIVGRNAEAGAAVVSAMQKVGDAEAAGQYRFLSCDLSSLRNCRTAVDSYIASVPHINYLVLCQTKATFQGLTPTEDGIDEKLVLNYFSRVDIVRRLLPKLSLGQASTGKAAVMSVLSAGVHAPYDAFREDFLLDKHNYSLKNAADAAGMYTDMAFGYLAREHPNVTFVHAAPGFVATKWGTNLPAPVRWGVRGLQATIARSKEDCAEFLFPALVAAEPQNGLRLVGEYGQLVQPTKYQVEDDMRYVYEQTVAALNRVRPPVE